MPPPMTVARMATKAPTSSELPVPTSVRSKMPRPSWSVPNQKVALGGFSRIAG